ncbi:MAG: zinc-binding dehydrogenase [Candidatus Thorarchaeota archaeon SMTZ1-45]|nr:MAG: alcohol dehydrogenase [Candidatus Thorarchaeota archaeon SMTZ1-45]
MKAAVFHEYGSPEVLKYEDFPIPEIGSNQVLVEVKAVALNHLDLLVRKGIPGLKLELPHILGSDISGIIKETGSAVAEGLYASQKVIIDPNLSCGVCEFCIRGEESLCVDYGILGEHSRGGYADFISVDEKNIIPIPEYSELDFSQAAAVPLTFMTAWRMLVTKARVRPGDDVLILGIGGGVALAALQIAKTAGARVLVTSSTDEKLEKAIELGASVGINYKTNPDFHKEVWNFTNRRGVDIVVDSVGEATWEKSLRSLSKGGKLVTCGATTGPNATTNLNLLFWKQLEILGSTMGSRSELRDVLKLVWNGQLNPVVDRILPLSKAQKAHEILEKSEQFGKLVLKP